MKLSENFALRQVAGTWVVMPLGDATLDFNGMMTLNDTGAFLWKALEQGSDKEALVAALTAEYAVDAERAATDVAEFITMLANAGCLVE
ncbi:MAG: PqqD family protein [Ruminococcaceae bacterium]|nr:PqqD family protein [Oscillospiraceae bacterium]